MQQEIIQMILYVYQIVFSGAFPSYGESHRANSKVWMVDQCKQDQGFHENILQIYSPAGELEMQKYLSIVFKGAMKMPQMRAAK